MADQGLKEISRNVKKHRSLFSFSTVVQWFSTWVPFIFRWGAVSYFRLFASAANTVAFCEIAACE